MESPAVTDRLQGTNPFSWLCRLLLVVALLLGFLLALPSLMSAHYVERAGRLMNWAGQPAYDSQRVLAHLQTAIRWRSNNAQAYRLLAQVYQERGEFEAAVQALARFTLLRPTNPLGHIELAQLYEMMDAESTGAADQNLNSRIAQEWQAAGFTTEDFVAAGELAARAKEYSAAMIEYNRAARLEPGLGDPWYYLGLMFEAQEQWDDALAAYERAATADHLRRIGRSNPHYRTGLVHQQQEPELEKALRAYELAATVNDFSSLEDAADCQYRIGDILRAQKADLREIKAAYEKAIELDPKHAWAHVRLGQTYYSQTGDFSLAATEIQKGLDLLPNEPWIYVVLGDLNLQDGRRMEAAAMYRHALEVKPDFEPALQRLSVMDIND